MTVCLGVGYIQKRPAGGSLKRKPKKKKFWLSCPLNSRQASKRFGRQAEYMRQLRSSRPDPPGGKLFKPRPRTRHGLEQCWVYLPREIIFGGEDDARFTPRRFILSGTKPVTLSGEIARRHRTARKHRCALRRASLTLGIHRMLIHPRIAIVGDSAGSGLTRSQCSLI